MYVSPLKYHITFDSTAKVIYDYFYYKKLKSVVIPPEIRVDGHAYPVTSIGESAFKDFDGLKHIEIPSSVTSIGDGAFLACIGLTNVKIPSSVMSIGGEAFWYCSGLTSINVATDNAIYSSENGVLYDKNRTKLICVPGGKKGKFVVPSNVISIGNGAFCGCSGLTSISIPSSVISIGDGAFYDCRALTSISIPSSVISIGDGAFYDCKALTSINIPSSVTSIGKNAFDGCENLEIVIDNSKDNVTVGESAFDGCKSVKYLK